MGALFLFGAGCGPTQPQQPPAPQAGENDRMMPPAEGGMPNEQMIHDADGDGDVDGTDMMHDTSTMPMGDASGTMPMGGRPGMKQSPPPEMTEDQSAELKLAEADHKPGEFTFHVKGGSFFYVPNMIKVKKGDKVKIVFENVGGMHNINIDEFNVKSETVQTDKETTVEFTADKTGSFEYYCSVGQHRAMGQKGTLVVE
jgi:plastocyanin